MGCSYKRGQRATLLPRHLRLESNPTALGAPGIAFLKTQLEALVLNGLNFADIIAKGNVTRVDIAVDIVGNLVWQESRKFQPTAIGENHRQFAANCKWEGSLLPNAAEKIGGTRYRPEPRFVMSWKTLRQNLRQTRNRSPKASEMRKTRSGQALAKSAGRRSRRYSRHHWTIPPN
jgi:hypothetical protein